MTLACGLVADQSQGCPGQPPAVVQMLWVQLLTFAAGWTQPVSALQTHLEAVQDSLQLQIAASSSHVAMGLQASQAGIHRARLLPVSSFKLPLAGLAASHDLQSLQSGQITQVEGEKQEGFLRVDVGHMVMLQPKVAPDAETNI